LNDDTLVMILIQHARYLLVYCKHGTYCKQNAL